MHTALYIIWFLIPSFFFILALFAKLEQYSKSAQKQNPRDLINQGLFVLVCVIISVIIDTYILESLVTQWVPEFLPLGMFQVLLLPFVLTVGAWILGPSKSLMIGSNRLNSMKNKRPR